MFALLPPMKRTGYVGGRVLHIVRVVSFYERVSRGKE